MLVIQAHSWASVCVSVCAIVCVYVCLSVCISGAAERALSAEGFMCTDMQLKGKDNKRLQIAKEGGKEPQPHTHCRTHTLISCAQQLRKICEKSTRIRRAHKQLNLCDFCMWETPSPPSSPSPSPATFACATQLGITTGISSISGPGHIFNNVLNI